MEAVKVAEKIMTKKADIDESEFMSNSTGKVNPAPAPKSANEVK